MLSLIFLSLLLLLFLHVELDGRVRKKRIFRVGSSHFPFLFLFTPSADTWLCNSALRFGMNIWRGYLICIEY